MKRRDILKAFGLIGLSTIVPIRLVEAIQDAAPIQQIQPLVSPMLSNNQLFVYHRGKQIATGFTEVINCRQEVEEMPSFRGDIYQHYTRGPLVWDLRGQVYPTTMPIDGHFDSKPLEIVSDYNEYSYMGECYIKYADLSSDEITWQVGFAGIGDLIMVPNELVL